MVTLTCYKRRNWHWFRTVAWVVKAKRPVLKNVLCAGWRVDLEWKHVWCWRRQRGCQCLWRPLRELGRLVRGIWWPGLPPKQSILTSTIVFHQHCSGQYFHPVIFASGVYPTDFAQKAKNLGLSFRGFSMNLLLCSLSSMLCGSRATFETLYKFSYKLRPIHQFIFIYCYCGHVFLFLRGNFIALYIFAGILCPCHASVLCAVPWIGRAFAKSWKVRETV